MIGFIEQDQAKSNRELSLEEIVYDAQTKEGYENELIDRIEKGNKL